MSRPGGDIQEQVRGRYAAAARSASSNCCEAARCGSDVTAAFETADSRDFGTWLYKADQLGEIPDGAALASLGCGNPTAVADLRPGEVVLDLGSGAGLDVLLSARRVGPKGFAYGIDMTDEMLELARKNQEESGIGNVEFRRGLIEDIPIDDAAIDVVISNCVINLSANKTAVFSEIARILRPGGRIGIADIVAEDSLSEAARRERGSWVGCIAGALSFAEYEHGLREAGFTNISIEATHEVADQMHSAIIKASRG